MLWTAFLPVLGLSILYCLQAKKESSLLLASVGDDSDMKIVPPSGITPSLEDAGEKAAQEFVAQKKNGNIDKAYSLGKRIAGVFFEENGPVLTFCEASLQPFICLQRKILFAFAGNHGIIEITSAAQSGPWKSRLKGDLPHGVSQPPGAAVPGGFF